MTLWLLPSTADVVAAKVVTIVLLSSGKKQQTASRVYGGMACLPCIVDNSMDGRVPRLPNHISGYDR